MVYVKINHSTPISPRLSGDDVPPPMLSKINVGGQFMGSREGDSANNFKAQFNDNADVRKKWGGGIMGIKSQHVMQRREKAIQIEQAKKLGLQIA